MDYDKKQYDSIEPGYYFKSTLGGKNSIQSFFNLKRFQKIIRAIKWGKDVTILDIGCGPGTLFYLANKYGLQYKELIGVDMAQPQVDFANRACKDFKNTKFICGDATKLDFKQKFDYIVFSELIEHLSYKDSKKFLLSVQELLKDDGEIVFTTPNYYSTWPLIEVVWSLIGKVNYLKQHINWFTIPKVKYILRSTKYVPTQIKTHFIVGPFTAFISKDLAKKICRIEEKLMPGLGTNMLVKARKNLYLKNNTIRN